MFRQIYQGIKNSYYIYLCMSQFNHIENQSVLLCLFVQPSLSRVNDKCCFEGVNTATVKHIYLCQIIFCGAHDFPYSFLSVFSFAFLGQTGVIDWELAVWDRDQMYSAWNGTLKSLSLHFEVENCLDRA